MASKLQSSMTDYTCLWTPIKMSQTLKIGFFVQTLVRWVFNFFLISLNIPGFAISSLQLIVSKGDFSAFNPLCKTGLLVNLDPILTSYLGLKLKRSAKWYSRMLKQRGMIGTSKLLSRNKCNPIIMALSSLAKKPLGLYAKIPISTAGFFYFIHFSSIELRIHKFLQYITVQYSWLENNLSEWLYLRRLVTIECKSSKLIRFVGPVVSSEPNRTATVAHNTSVQHFSNSLRY